MPFILLMAVTGLVILYTQPIHDAMEGDRRVVAVGDHYVSYDQQEQAVEAVSAFGKFCQNFSTVTLSVATWSAMTKGGGSLPWQARN